ncbi:MAG TPA: GTPase HflX, partial [Gammaproteobacteria bacterium]|nr:GTPase HflX [Gammaproteobacteria bacterium]
GEPEKSSFEFTQLVTSAGLNIAATVTGKREKPHPRHFVGVGKLDEIYQLVLDMCADVVLFDHALTPGQERHLRDKLKVPVLDRSGLILDIFSQRARSFEGRLQVELAQLKHLSVRLIRGWTHLERQKGGIGLRGPGETQLETDRRLIAQRIKQIRHKLDRVRSQREQG